MKLDPILTKACRLARSGKYQAAIRVLEPEVNRYHGSYHYYYLLGSSYLRLGDFGGALTYFRLAHDTKHREPTAILGLATLFLRRGETQRALDHYLDVIEINPKNSTAIRAMKVIKTQARKDTLSNWLEAGKLPVLYPPIPFTGFSVKEITAAFGVLLIVALLTVSILIRSKVIPSPFYPRGTREGAASFILSREDRIAPAQTGGSYRYILTRVQWLDTYERALNMFNAKRDEAARINLNRIIDSNAAEEVKNRSRIIMSYLEIPGFDTFSRIDNVTYNEVMVDPMLYNGVHVIWRGMATNVTIDDSATTFDFLVGYDTRKTLEGIVPVVFNHAIPLNPERPLELLCRIIPISPDVPSAKGSSPIRLEGVAIHQSSNL